MDDEMTDERNPPEAELARLADGSLPGPREAELRAQVKASPELTAALAEQERAVAMLRALDQPAPASLRARVEELTGAGASAGAGAGASAGAGGTGGVGARGRPARRRLMRWPPVLVLPGVTALAVAVAAVVILAGGSTSAPTVPQAARLALASATLPAPGVDSADHDQLDVSAAGIPFPNWATTSRWTTSGARRDRVGGRTVTTGLLPRPQRHRGRLRDQLGCAAGGRPRHGRPALRSDVHVATHRRGQLHHLDPRGPHLRDRRQFGPLRDLAAAGRRRRRRGGGLPGRGRADARGGWSVPVVEPPAPGQPSRRRVDTLRG